MGEIPFYKDRKQLADYLLLGVFFTLPMYMRVNNYLFFAYLAIQLLYLIREKRVDAFSVVLRRYWPVWGLAAVALLAGINQFAGDVSLKFMEKYLGALLFPFAFLAHPGSRDSRTAERYFWAFTWGCAATLLICYSNAIYIMITKSEPLSYLLRWRHLGHLFTEIADTHPTYLGGFIAISTHFLLGKKGIKPALKWGLLTFFFLGLFQLSSRMALLLFLGTGLLHALSKLRTRGVKASWKLMFLVIPFAVFFLFGSEYFSERVLDISSYLGDKRFERWVVSWELFTDHPLSGIGAGELQAERMRLYKEYGFTVAANEKYNAHNQLLEFLTLLGWLGGAFYLGVFGYLIKQASLRKDYLFFGAFVLFFLLNLTESMMVRIKGIEFYILFATLFLWMRNGSEEESLDPKASSSLLE